MGEELAGSEVIEEADVGATPVSDSSNRLGNAVPEMEYEPSLAARPVVVNDDGYLMRITVPMQGLYVPVPGWIAHLDLLALVVGSLWWAGTLLTRLLLRLPKPPRAVFEITFDQLTMILCDPASGELNVLTWPRPAVAEVRANRYERGLWINVTGHVKQTYLSDLTPETIDRLAVELRDALARKNYTFADAGSDVHGRKGTVTATPLVQRVPENAPGDFYVMSGRCTRCCIVHGEAPDVLNDPNEPFEECYFRRQPKTSQEIDQAISAIWASEVGGLRYAGNDPAILQRLREIGCAAQCDQTPEGSK